MRSSGSLVPLPAPVAPQGRGLRGFGRTHRVHCSTVRASVHPHGQGGNPVGRLLHQHVQGLVTQRGVRMNLKTNGFRFMVRRPDDAVDEAAAVIHGVLQLVANFTVEIRNGVSLCQQKELMREGARVLRPLPLEPATSFPLSRALVISWEPQRTWSRRPHEGTGRGMIPLYCVVPPSQARETPHGYEWRSLCHSFRPWKG